MWECCRHVGGACTEVPQLLLVVWLCGHAASVHAQLQQHATPAVAMHLKPHLPEPAGSSSCSRIEPVAASWQCLGRCTRRMAALWRPRS